MKKPKDKDYDDDTIYFDIPIDFSSIGTSIKKSVNSAIRAFTEDKDNKNLPQTRNAKVCAQKPPEIGKAQAFKALSIILGLGFLTSFIVSASLFADYRGFFYFLTTVLSFGLTFLAPYLSWRVSKEYYRLSNNYVRFLRELGNSTVISIRDLASSVAQSEQKTVSDLLKMMKRGYFHQARIVEDDSLFLLDIPTFRLYKEKKTEIPEVRPPRIEEDEQMELSAEDLSVERARDIINSGNFQLEKIVTFKGKIRDSNFRDNVDMIVDNTQSILKIIGKYPEKSYALNKFSDYYLPTTAKLVESYWEFESMMTNDSKIIGSMEDINQSILTIGEAFDRMKVELLSDRAMDIKTDIDTINLLLNQEGYAEDDWKSNN